jgi:hypothetical protein
MGPEQIAVMGQSMSFMMIGTAIIGILIGSIYPIVTLVLFTRPSAKAASAARRKLFRD